MKWSRRRSPRKSKRRRRLIKGYDPIALIRACFPGIRDVAPIRRQSGYFITDDGRVVSLARAEPRIRAHSVTKDGLVMVRTASKTYSAARLVLEVFGGGGARSRKFLAEHINGVREDNRIENLRWITNSNWKSEVMHPAQRKRASSVDTRVAIVRIRHRYRDAGRIRAVEGFPTYFVDDGGRIYSLWGMEARRLVPRHDHAPVSLRGPDGAKGQLSWGSIVATAFVGPRPSTGHYVIHLDGDASNFRASNLAWRKRGPVPNTPRFGPEEVRAIRFLKTQGESSLRIGAVFGCSDASVDDIASGRAYAHVASLSGDPLKALSPRLIARIQRETRFGATLAPAAYVKHQIARIRQAFPNARALRQIAGHLDYFVSRDGRVYSTQRGRVRELAVCKGCVGLVGDKSRQISVKVLVEETFGRSRGN